MDQIKYLYANYFLQAVAQYLKNPWIGINLDTGNVDVHYQLYNNQPRVVAFNEGMGHPADTQYQEEQIVPQDHY